MPVTTKKIGGKYRVVESESGQIAKNRSGTPVDGGGHKTADRATAQARAINASLQKRGKI